jgi:SagB-type dehydrogenase family enzyme
LRYDPDDKNGELYKPINIGLNIDKIRRFCAGNIGWMATSKAVIVFVVDFEKIESRYSCKGKDYALIEIGHIAQNILLLAQTLGINTVPVGAFDREGLSDFFPTGDVYYMVFLGKN